MADMTWDYIAGFIDGEGLFTIASQKYYFHPRLSISQNTRYVLEEIQEYFVQYGIVSHINKELHKPRKNAWYCLRVNQRKSLIIICKYLKGKLYVKDEQLTVIEKILQIPSGDKTRHIQEQRTKRIRKSLVCRKEIMRLNQERAV